MSSSIFNRVISAIVVAALIPVNAVPALSQEPPPPAAQSEPSDRPLVSNLPDDTASSSAPQPE